jgi:hypothetical protein
LGATGVPKVIRGSVVTHRRRCGKARCRCSAGGDALHESTVLSYSEGGRTRFVMLAPDRVEAVRAATARYRDRLAAVEADGDAGRAALIALLAVGRGRR